VKYQDYYQVLGVSRGASQEEISRAYRKLARQYHPDVSKAKSAELKFREITEAYEVLKDAEKRKRYDALGADWKAGQDFRAPQGWPGAGVGAGRRARTGGARVEHADFGDFGGFSEFFESLFGGMGGVGGGVGAPPFGGAHRAGQPRARQRHAPPPPAEADITISLADAFRGGTRRISFDLVGTDSSGRESRSTRTFDVRIPPGTTEGSVIRLAGQGPAHDNGAARGDLLLRVHIAPDPRLRLDGHDLHTTVPITPSEAVLGAKVEVPLVEQSTLVTVPPGSQSGQKLRLRGKGLPKRASGGPSGGPQEYGDVFVELRIVVPKEPSEAERRLYEQLAQASNFKPRGP
jgi:curved DNA-binding protein